MNQYKKIPTVKLSLCEYRKDTKSLTLASEYFGMPNEFDVLSHHTGRTVRFVPVKYGDPLFCQDNWDGEQAIYRPVEKTPNVEYLVIYHCY